MLRKVLLIGLVVVMFPALVHAQGPQGKSFGLGLALGDPVGITGKYWFSRKNALDFGLGWNYYRYGGMMLWADYQYNVFTLVRAKDVSFNLLFYMGVGGKLGFWHHHPHDRDEFLLGLGVRIPIGITMVFVNAPFDVFFEIVPGMAFIAPHPFWFDLDASIGGRFYF